MIDTPGRAWELQKLGIVEGMKSWNALKSELLKSPWEFGGLGENSWNSWMFSVASHLF